MKRESSEGLNFSPQSNGAPERHYCEAPPPENFVILERALKASVTCLA